MYHPLHQVTIAKWQMLQYLKRNDKPKVPLLS